MFTSYVLRRLVHLSMSDMKKAVVVGANGYIGTRLTLGLAKSGVEVVALVDGRFSYDRLENEELIHTVEFSLESIDTLYDISEFEGADVLYHLAWMGVNALYRNEAEVQVQNVMFSLKVMEFAEHYHINRIIIPGSAAESSCGDGVITGEEKPAPSDMYSASKVAARYVCGKYAEMHKMDIIYCLITSIYGPGRNDNNLISYVITSLLKGEPNWSKNGIISTLMTLSRLLCYWEAKASVVRFILLAQESISR